MMLPIGERIRTLRRAKNETQDELSALLGVSFQAVSRWENGDAYPDIELLPKLAAHFGVTTDELLGADEETVQAERKKKLEEYRSVLSTGDGTMEHYGIAIKAYREFPEHPSFAVRALYDLVIHKCMPREQALPVVRELCESLVGTSEQSEAVRFIYLFEDEDKLARWEEMTAWQYTSPRLYEERYDYREEIENCNRQRQKNLYADLVYGFFRYFGKRAEGDREDPASWTAGLECALRIIDCLRDPSDDEDGWISERAYILMRLARYRFLLGKRAEGYDALRKAVDLAKIVMSRPPEYEFPFHTPVLDLVSGSRLNDFYPLIVESDSMASYFYNRMVTIGENGTGWFEVVKDEPEYQALAARIRAMKPADAE
ncbi:MAG: helix-turn-helix transcriptional regulator [Clostridia bacterium]|nr:helix-turn-helix transcriptional regulator [Clostridia bacterium]